VDTWDSGFEGLLRSLLPFLPERDAVTADLDLVAAGLDSLGMVELLIQVEERYGITFPDDLVAQETFATPAALWSVVSGLLAGRPVGG
jgi:acyl carrier protein